MPLLRLRHGWLWSYNKPILACSSWSDISRTWLPSHVAAIQQRSPVRYSVSIPLHADQRPFQHGQDSHEQPAELLEDANIQREIPTAQSLVIDHGPESTMARDGKLTTFYDLLHESNVTASSGTRVRMVDEENHRLDYALWFELLRFRSRYHGHHGSWEIFQGLRRRAIDLPVEGLEAEQIWDPIIIAGLELGHKKQLWQYSLDLYSRTGQRYSKLYTLLVGHHLPQRIKRALESHESFRAAELLAPGDVLSIMSSVDTVAFEKNSLRQMYLNSMDRHTYDTIISRLCLKRRYRLAASWHSFLMGAGDFPSSANIVQPLLQHLTLSGRYQEHERVLESLRKAGITAMPDITAGSDTNGMFITANNSRSVSDAFCARAFATRAFTPGVVIRTMATFGVKSIGAVSLRELAVRCRDLVQSFGPDSEDPNETLAREVTNQLDNLEAAGIRLQDCKFVSLVSRLAREGHGALLEAVLSSDQHPDVYEDKDLQIRLLRSYITAEDWSQVHRTAAVLSFVHDSSATVGWNTLLRAYMDYKIPNRNERLNTVLQAMRRLNVPVTTKSIRHSYFTLLVGWKTDAAMHTRAEVSQLVFVTQMWLDALRSGSNVPARGWNYILRRFGRLGFYVDLERLCLWLAHYYSHNLEISSATFRRRSKEQLNLIFPPMMQRAIVEWYFKSLSIDTSAQKQIPRDRSSKLGIAADLDIPPALSNTETWARGLTLLRLLGAHGLTLHAQSIKRGIRTRLRILYGHGISSKPENRVAMANNPHSLARMLGYLKHVWKPVRLGPLFPDVPDVLLTKLPPWDRRGQAFEKMLRLRFGNANADALRRRRFLSERLRRQRGEDLGYRRFLLSDAESSEENIGSRPNHWRTEREIRAQNIRQTQAPDMAEIAQWLGSPETHDNDATETPR